MRCFSVTLCCLIALAQDRPFRVQTKVVEVPVMVRDKAGQNIDGLTAGDFAVFDNGVRQQEVSLTEIGNGLAPISLVVAIQSAGTSKLALAEIRRIGGMIQPLISGLKGEVAILSFDRDINWLQDFTGNDDRIRSVIKGIRPGSMTGARMFDAIGEAVDRLNRRTGRKMLLLISQSNDSGSGLKFEQAVEIVDRAGIEVFAAHYSSYAMSWIAKSEDFPEKPELDAMFFSELGRIGAPNHVKALAQSTGGADYGFARQRGLENAMDKMGIEVHTQYIVSFPQRDKAPGMHRIEVSLPERSGARIRSRRVYWADPF